MKKPCFGDSRNAMHFVALKVLSELYFAENNLCTYDDFVGLCYRECRRVLRKKDFYCPALLGITERVWRSFEIF